MNTAKHEINCFTARWIQKLNDPATPYLDIAEKWGFEMKSLGFILDCGESLETACPGSNALFDYQAMRQIIDRINSVDLLTAALFSKWRYLNHWAMPGEDADFLSPNNKAWFLLVLARLEAVTKGVENQLSNSNSLLQMCCKYP